MSIFRGQHGFVYAYPGTDSARGFLEVCIALRMLGLRAGAGGSSMSVSQLREGVTNTVCCTRRKPSEAGRHPLQNPSAAEAQ